MDTNKILITGGCGFLGQHLTKDIHEAFPCSKIRIIDLRANPAALFDFSNLPQVEITLDTDICDYDSLSGHFEGVDLVIHLAGVVSFSLKDKELLNNVNVQGTANVLKAAAAAQVKNFIHISSVAALGYNDDRGNPVNEDYQFDFQIARKRHKYYMLTKYLADEEVKKSAQNGLSTITLYPGLMFGPGDTTNSARLINALYNRKIPFNMPGGTNIVDVRDVSKGIVSVIKNPPLSQDYLLSGHNLSFRQINRTIAEALSVARPKLTLPKFLNTPLFKLLYFIESKSKNKLQLTADNLDSAFKFRYFDNSKASEEINWKPSFTFQQTINDTIEWMKQNDLIER